MTKSKPLFQRRHYEIIAAALGRAIGAANGDFLKDLEVIFQRDNPLFNKAKFREAVEKAAFPNNQGASPHV